MRTLIVILALLWATPVSAQPPTKITEVQIHVGWLIGGNPLDKNGVTVSIPIRDATVFIHSNTNIRIVDIGKTDPQGAIHLTHPGTDFRLTVLMVGYPPIIVPDPDLPAYERWRKEVVAVLGKK